MPTVPNPAISVNGASAGVKYSTGPGSAISASISDTGGIYTVAWSVEKVDETLTATAVTLTQSGQVGETVSFTYPSEGGESDDGYGTALVLKALVNGGQVRGVSDTANTVGRVKVYAGTTYSSLEVGTVGETTESGQYGMTPSLNDVIRRVDRLEVSSASGDTATGTVHYDYDLTDYCSISATLDDRENIQSAIDIATAAAAADGRHRWIWAPPGEYRFTYSNNGPVNYSIQLRSNVTIIGAGPELTKFAFSSSWSATQGIETFAAINPVVNATCGLQGMSILEKNNPGARASSIIINAVRHTGGSVGTFVTMTMKDLVFDSYNFGSVAWRTTIDMEAFTGLVEMENVFAVGHILPFACWAIESDFTPHYEKRIHAHNIHLVSADVPNYGADDERSHGMYVHPNVSYRVTNFIIGMDRSRGYYGSAYGTGFAIQHNGNNPTESVYGKPEYCIMANGVVNNGYDGISWTGDNAMTLDANSILTSTATLDGTAKSNLALTGWLLDVPGADAFRVYVTLASQAGAYDTASPIEVVGITYAGNTTTVKLYPTDTAGGETIYGDVWFTRIEASGIHIGAQTSTSGEVQIGNLRPDSFTYQYDNIYGLGNARGFDVRSNIQATNIVIEPMANSNGDIYTGAGVTLTSDNFKHAKFINCSFKCNDSFVNTGVPYGGSAILSFEGCTFLKHGNSNAALSHVYLGESTADNSVSLRFNNCDFYARDALGGTWGQVNRETKFTNCRFIRDGGSALAVWFAPFENYSRELGPIEFVECEQYPSDENGVFMYSTNGYANWSCVGDIRIRKCDFPRDPVRFDKYSSAQYGHMEPRQGLYPATLTVSSNQVPLIHPARYNSYTVESSSDVYTVWAGDTSMNMYHGSQIIIIPTGIFNFVASTAQYYYNVNFDYTTSSNTPLCIYFNAVTGKWSKLWGA